MQAKLDHLRGAQHLGCSRSAGPAQEVQAREATCKAREPLREHVCHSQRPSPFHLVGVGGVYDPVHGPRRCLRSWCRRTRGVGGTARAAALRTRALGSRAGIIHTEELGDGLSCVLLLQRRLPSAVAAGDGVAAGVACVDGDDAGQGPFRAAAPAADIDAPFVGWSRRQRHRPIVLLIDLGIWRPRAAEALTSRAARASEAVALEFHEAPLVDVVHQ
mmetsp:Transcript_102680/g.201363  ORF Transcript_102680/g.201363 Transcript_102680/m.201363 type:complete len:217 (+) Transcript_102680:182-832(+)